MRGRPGLARARRRRGSRPGAPARRPVGRALAPALALALALAIPAPAAEPPSRVVSINLCTDLLLMLVAEPDQIAALSHVARDPVVSPMAEAAHAFPTTSGGAEDIQRRAPDLVVAGVFSDPVTLAMLDRLNLRVERFPLEDDFDAIRTNIARMGDLVGQPGRAAAQIAAFDAALAAIGRPRPRARAATFATNGFTAGIGTLTDAVLDAAGLDNVAAEYGLSGMARLGLERLALAAPDLVVMGRPYAPPVRGQEVLEHPAARAAAPAVQVSDALWVCGTPLVADAVRALVEARR